MVSTLLRPLSPRVSHHLIHRGPGQRRHSVTDPHDGHCNPVPDGVGTPMPGLVQDPGPDGHVRGGVEGSSDGAGDDYRPTPVHGPGHATPTIGASVRDTVRPLVRLRGHDSGGRSRGHHEGRPRPGVGVSTDKATDHGLTGGRPCPEDIRPIMVLSPFSTVPLCLGPVAVGVGVDTGRALGSTPVRPVEAREPSPFDHGLYVPV